MLDNAIPQGFEDAVELRRKNRETVVKYMNTKGQDRLRRHELFVEDGCGGLWTTDTGSPIVIRGKDKLAEHAVWSLKCFPDWEWYNIKVFETDDPNHFWVECDGHGKILFPGYPEGYYENHFLHSFELDDGKIKRNREFMNVWTIYCNAYGAAKRCSNPNGAIRRACATCRRTCAAVRR
ncbi:PhzA/PhzB family protein [Pseudomonas aeruginosa]|uniref:PhzA/PhzB family protein n=1 Tax=Pseudomonas aeruginosa TaxID=287 RepID=UPI001EE255B1|nr:PhzA/PhzB family protein [Pseudomonas aeruginosa]